MHIFPQVMAPKERAQEFPPAGLLLKEGLLPW